MTSHPPPLPQKSHLVATHTPLPPPAKKQTNRINKENHQVKTCTLVGVVEGRGGYIQKYPSTVLVPPQLYSSSTHPTAHTRTQNKAYPLPQRIPILPNIPSQWQTPPPTPTPLTHNYNTIQNFVDLKIGLNQYLAINQVFV